MIGGTLTVSHSTSRPVSSCMIGERFDLPSLTALGGVNLLVDFTRDGLGLRQALVTADLPVKAPWAHYSMADDVETLVTAYMVGLERISHIEEWERDPLLCKKLGLAKLPDSTTLYRTLERYRGAEDLKPLAIVNRRVLGYIPAQTPEGCILDLDTTVKPVYGQQQGASVGYNPRYRGRASFQPLMAFLSPSRAVVHVALRSGQTPDTTENVAFYRQALAQLPPCAVEYVRADKGFTSEAFCQALDDDGLRYVLKLRITASLRARIDMGVRWQDLPSDDPMVRVQAGVVLQPLNQDGRRRRVVLIRSQPVDQQRQLDLFGDAGWDYQAIVTNLYWSPEDIWHFYNQRCDAENAVKELKHGIHAGAINKAGFWANAANLWLRVIAYNALLAFKVFAPAPYRRFSVTRLQRTLLRVPAVLIRHARQWTLRLPAWWPHQTAWRQIRWRLATL